MIPDKTSFKNVPYTCSGGSVKPLFGCKTSHYRFRYIKSRCNITVVNNTMHGKSISAQLNEQGDSVFLPWQENHITSLRLEAPLQANIGVKFFYTANMHGCKFYVDTIKRSNDVVVYHANAKEEDPGGDDRAPNSQLPACVQKLDELHGMAQREYGNIIQKNIISFGKTDYFKDANPLVALKKVRVLPVGIRKRKAEWGGKCFVYAYPAGGKWKFYYQTFGQVSYDRPSGAGNVILGAITGHWKYLHKLRTEGKTGIVRPFSVISSGEIPILR